MGMAIVRNIKSENNASSLKNRDCFRMNTMPYVELQTRLLKMMEKVSKEQMSVHAAFLLLVSSNELFGNQPKGGWRIAWPYHDSLREITVKATRCEETSHLKLELSYLEERFLSIAWQMGNDIIASLHDSEGKWTKREVSDLIDHFNQVIRAKRITYVDGTIVEIQKNNIHSFNKEEFDKFIQQYSEHHLTARINNVIVNHAAEHANDYTFKLQWPESLNHHHQLKVTFSRADKFRANYSWFVNEKTLVNMFPKFNNGALNTGQFYYSLKVSELANDKEQTAQQEVEVLSLWLTLDGLFGELRDVTKGVHLSGNDVLNIYNFFDQLFKVKNTFICDASRLVNEDETIHIPLRLISALSSGKTWYESKLKGVTLFECSQFATVSNDVINQNKEKRNEALKELQMLPLQKWYAMLDSAGKMALRDIYISDEKCQKARPRRSVRLFEKSHAQVDFGKTTLQEFTAKVYSKAKERKEITPTLATLAKLLCDGICLYEDKHHKLDENMPDFWVKSRVRELMWGGYFWVKEYQHC